MDEDEGGLGGGCGDGAAAASAVAGPEEDGSLARAGAASEVGGGSVWK